MWRFVAGNVESEVNPLIDLIAWLGRKKRKGRGYRRYRKKAPLRDFKGGQ
jgi:hypothetical protein